ncbi:excalibur calcium-binding domain-containing protein [Nostoc sp. CENA67]|uniref:Excalibur calcium-binding domain-containing protein n=1 Tax=Amazonocrinis nigriterrae CENA67 TaxID=2794033 RepID=A0A8J7LEI1_9NOST|nr:excalibur calcium-binding domain-containing protein [Amazonocrinis nigriterrae]MBH8566766.1 excalibur calcium-binding domain-containing protein [Amazonocrinis nigriterrae CENA67]
MFNLLLLVNLASIIAFVTGLINPKLVLRGKTKTRRRSSEVYLSAFVLSFVGMIIFLPKPEPDAISAPPIPKEVKPTQTPQAVAKPTLTPTPKATPTPEFVAFDPSVCKSDRYLPVNGASIALYTTCQYLNTDLIKPESVSVVTGANDNENPSVLELQSESGFEKVAARDYSLTSESGDVCVEYKDKSVSCFAFSDSGQAEVQIQQPQETVIPIGAKCENFATQADAQAALSANPQLDRDGDGTACDSLASGGTRHTGQRRRKR